MSDKTIQLKPKTSHFFWEYLAGILLIPLLGLGIFIIYKLIKKQSSITYVISNHDITLIDSKKTDRIVLAEIENIELHQSWTDRKFNTGTLHISAEESSSQMIGLENPIRLKELLLSAAKAEKMRLKKASEKKEQQMDPPSLHLDKLDYLTGLWQQGLLSDDDYLQEKKHFES